MCFFNLYIHAFITLELLKIIEVHKNVGLCPESQVDGQHVSGTDKAHLAFEVCVRPPTSACGSNRAMDAKKKKKKSRTRPRRGLNLRHTY